MFRKFAGLTAVAGLFIAGTASAEITGSAHDLREDLFGTNSTGALGEICVVCHAPHGVDTDSNANGDLLWNRSTQTAGDYQVYDSPTLDKTASPPGDSSVLCLGCHDGQIAVDSYGGATGTAALTIGGTGNPWTSLEAFGTELGNDHPIGITYDNASDPELNDPTVADALTFGDGSTGTINDILFQGVVECGTCHDVHATVSGNNAKLLVVDNSGSAFCLECHDK